MSRRPAVLWAAVACFLLPVVPGRGQWQEPLAWTDCVRIAVTQHPGLAAARAQVAAAAAGTGVARAAGRPHLSAGAGADHVERDAAASDDVGYNVALSLEQSLYSGGRNPAAVRAAEAGLVRATAQAARTAAETSYELRTAFIDLLHAQEQLVLLRTIENRRRDNRELVELRYEGGREHKGSLALSDAALFDAAAQVRQAERNGQLAALVLLRTMGVTNQTAVAVTGTLAVAAAELPGAVTEAMAAGTPPVAALQAACAVAVADVDRARGAYRPTVGLNTSAGRSGNEDDFADDQWKAGVSMSFPFWSGGQQGYELARARAGVSQAEADLAAALNAQVRTMAGARVQWWDAVDNVAVQNAYVEAATVRAEIARQQYQDGLLAFDDWDLIENDLIGKRKSLLAATRAALLAEAGWQRVCGHSVFPSPAAGEDAP